MTCPGESGSDKKELFSSFLFPSRNLLSSLLFYEGYSHLSDTEAPIIPTDSKAPEIPTVFWLGSYLSDSKKGPW